jgi:hypothetical protein
MAQYVTVKEKAELAKPYEAKAISHWRNRLTDFQQATLEHTENIVYGMALEGALVKDIVAFFQINKGDFDQLFGAVYDSARAELAITIKKNQLRILKANKQPQAQALLGKLFADQTEVAALEAPVQDNDVNITVSVVGADGKVGSIMNAPDLPSNVTPSTTH